MAESDSTAGATPDTDATSGAENDETTTGATPDETLGDAGKRVIAEQRRATRAAEQRASELEAKLKEYEDRDKSELERAQERATTAEARVSELERESWARTAAAEALVPSAWEYLRGATEDELKQAAKAFAERYGTDEQRQQHERENGSTTTVVDLGSGARPGAPATGNQAMNERIRARRR